MCDDNFITIRKFHTQTYIIIHLRVFSCTMIYIMLWNIMCEFLISRFLIAIADETN